MSKLILPGQPPARRGGGLVLTAGAVDEIARAQREEIAELVKAARRKYDAAMRHPIGSNARRKKHAEMMGVLGEVMTKARATGLAYSDLEAWVRERWEDAAR